jgi:integrase
MGRNLQYQFLNAIDQAFDGGGHDKHTDKHNAKHLDTVYSYAERSSLVELSSQVGKFIKENYIDTKRVLDIKGEMIQSFINSKANSCNQETLGQYASRIHKLEHIVNDIYKGKVSWYSDLIVPASNLSSEKTRNIAMTRNDFNSILNRAYAMQSKSNAVIAIELAGRFGMRVSEACKLQPRDINIEDMKLHIHESKGGRSRDIDIKPEDAEYLKKIIDGKVKDKSIVSIKEDSVNKYLVRSEEALRIRDRYRNADTGIHSIRKMVAQELYDKHRENGLSKKESLNLVSAYLGHGKNREQTMKQYILNIH